MPLVASIETEKILNYRCLAFCCTRIRWTAASTPAPHQRRLYQLLPCTCTPSNITMHDGGTRAMFLYSKIEVVTITINNDMRPCRRNWIQA